MNGTKNLKILLGILGVMLVAVVAYNIMKSGKKAASYDPQLVQVDTALVDKISITPKGGDPAFDVEKKNGAWVISAEGKQFPADEAGIKNMIGQLVDVKSQRVASTKKESWEKYEITDSAATHIKLYVSGGVVSDIYLGKFSFKQSQNPYQKQPDITSYIRKAGDDRVYATAGMLSMAFNRQYKDLRNQTLVALTPEGINKVSVFQNGSNYELAKHDSLWTVAGMPADSAKTVQYLNSLRTVRHREFADDVSVAGLMKVASIAIASDLGENITVSAYDAGAGQYYLTSDMNPESVFKSDSTGPFQRLFKPASEFIADVPVE